MTSSVNRGCGDGWQGMGTEVPQPSGRHKPVHLSMWDKASKTEQNKPCTRKERARTEESEDKCGINWGERHTSCIQRHKRDGPEQGDARVLCGRGSELGCRFQLSCRDPVFSQSLSISNHLLIPQSHSLWQYRSCWALETGVKHIPGLVAAPVLLAPANFCLFVPALL